MENRAVGLMGQYEYDKAVELLEQIAGSEGISDQQRYEFEVDLAIGLLNRRNAGDLERAAALLDAVMKAAPANIRAKYCRALLHFHAGETSTARELFQQTADADGKDAYAVYYVGQCWLLEGVYQQAWDSFSEAMRIDPYLRSAYYGAFQAAQLLQKQDVARESVGQFQRLATNPRAKLAELKYTRMGPKADVSAKTGAAGDSLPAPSGQLFDEPTPLAIAGGDAASWQSGDDSTAEPVITVADIDGDQRSDLFITRAFAPAETGPRNAVLLGQASGYALQSDHPLASVPDVNAALWGDYDNDGRTDVYLCRRGPNQLWRRDSSGRWLNDTEAAQASAGDGDTVDGACFDSDHDGDLDYLLVSPERPRQLLNNDRDGTFRSIADESGVAGEGRASRQVLIADVDTDDDADLVFINRQPPHDVLVNDRFWRYHRAEGFDAFSKTPCDAAVAADVDVDGQVELFTFGPSGILKWSPDDNGQWVSAQLVAGDGQVADGYRRWIAVADVDGDLQLEIITVAGATIRVIGLDGAQRYSYAASRQESKAIPAATILQTNRGPALLAARQGAAPLVLQPGGGRHPFLLLTFSGKRDEGAEMRSNASGIGVLGAARVGEKWAAIPPYRCDSGPGQSLQPYSIGLGDRDEIDFVRLLWPDSVSQTELNLAAGQIHRITEVQRQVGSCPIVFAWDGRRFAFVTDVLGVGGIGFNLGRAEYAPPRPTENLLMPPGLLKPRDGRFIVKLGEPMEEVCYFDAARLVAYDVPNEWHMTLDERFGVADPAPTGKPVFFRNMILPLEARNHRGDDVTEQIVSVDQTAAPVERSDRRFIGLADEHSVTLTFKRPIDAIEAPVVLFDGWIEYPYSQTTFAAWQADCQFLPPTIEARGENGDWQVVAERFGYMAGMPRQATVPLDRQRIPQGAKQLRISTNMEIYWDRLALVDAGRQPVFRRRELPLAAATVNDVGFPRRTTLAQHRPVYDYGDRPPFGDTRHARGYYTAFGDAQELVETTDDAVVVIGPGEELHLEFDASVAAPEEGWKRFYVLEADGWCKDADLFTQHAGVVEPLPVRRNIAQDAQAMRRRDHLHRRYNMRFESGY